MVDRKEFFGVLDGDVARGHHGGGKGRSGKLAFVFEGFDADVVEGFGVVVVARCDALGDFVGGGLRKEQGREVGGARCHGWLCGVGERGFAGWGGSFSYFVALSGPIAARGCPGFKS